MTRYVAFLSYSHRNKAETEWLHKALERYHIPKKLVGKETAKGKVPARLIPIFRDRDELSASADLGKDLRGALEQSNHLIVIASPYSARSPYVQEEVRFFKSLHGEHRVFALIVSGEPYATAMPGQEEEEAFPASLRFRLDAQGQISNVPAEPIAADIRPGKDGRRLALMKLIAGITGLRLDDLVQREAQRRARRLTTIASGASIGMLLATGLAVYANQQRILAVEQRQIAERETAAARAATDYLIGTFELTDPATENPRTVSLVTILERGAERARLELQNQPEIEARLVTAVGRAYNNLGLLDDAEVALARALPAINRAGPDGAPALVALANTHVKKGEFEKAAKVLDGADTLLGPDLSQNLSQRSELMLQKGNIAYANGDAQTALAFYDQALSFINADPAGNPRTRAKILEQRGKSLMDLGNFKAAEVALQDASKLYRQFDGEQHFATGLSYYNLALLAYNAGQNDLAQERIQKSLRIVARVLDRTNPILADVLSLQGSIYIAQGKLNLADKALADSIAAYRSVYSGPHFNIGFADFYRAQVAMKRGRIDEALLHLNSAQRNYEASYGNIHANIGEVMVIRAGLLARQGKVAQAKSDCNAGIGMLNQTVGPDSSFTKGLKETCDIIERK